MYKRIVIFSCIIVLLLSAVSGRVGYIIFSGSYKASDTYNSYVLNVDTKIVNLYYRDFEIITNNKNGYVAVIRPNEKCLGELNKIFNYSEIKDIIDELKNGLPVIRKVNKNYKCKYIQIYETYESENNLKQLIAKSSNGILNHIDNNIGVRKIKFSVDANRRLLEGDNGEIVDEKYSTPEGYRLSIDKHIQQIAINSSVNLQNGCIIVMNIKDSSILAMVNKPFDNFTIKAFSNYAIGSAFKLVVSICALENNVDLIYDCNGSIKIADTVYNCQNNKSHNMQNLKQALANSCNCYFVKLANKLGKEKLLETCDKLGFNSNTELFDKWYVENAVLPTSEQLSSKGELSLFGFGQGKLTVTPLQMASLLCTIGNFGKYQQPKLFISNINNKGLETIINYDYLSQVISLETSKTMLEYMNYVVTDGTGFNANTKDNMVAGKTATAQTGQFNFGIEKLNTWFVGLYPYTHPQYAIVVLKENGESGAKDCCPIFRTIVEQL